MNIQNKPYLVKLMLKGIGFFLLILFIDRVVLGYFVPTMKHLELRHIAMATLGGMLIGWLRNYYQPKEK